MFSKNYIYQSSSKAISVFLIFAILLLSSCTKKEENMKDFKQKEIEYYTSSKWQITELYTGSSDYMNMIKKYYGDAVFQFHLIESSKSKNDYYITQTSTSYKGNLIFEGWDYYLYLFLPIDSNYHNIPDNAPVTAKNLRWSAFGKDENKFRLIITLEQQYIITFTRYK